MNRRLTTAQQTFEQGDYDAAIRWYEAALELDPNNQTAKNALKEVRRAKLAEEELRAKQRQAEVNRRLTTAQPAFERGDYDAAIRGYEAVLGLDPNNQTAKKALEGVRRAKAAEGEVLRRLKKPK